MTESDNAELDPVLLDSRRLTGASMLLSRPGAILETRLPSARKRRLMRRWSEYTQTLYHGLGWNDQEIVARDQGPSQMLAATAPIDALLPATFVLEQALRFAMLDPQRPTAAGVAAALDELESRIARRTDPYLAALQRCATRHDAQLLIGERDVSVGEGKHSQCWPDDELPMPDQILWQHSQHHIPTALVTGTNGKTTTSRLLAHMLREAGHTVGFSCTDYVQVGEKIVDRDDYSGPTGARMVLRHPDTTAAVLETARGGLLRRGIQVRMADVAVITNVAADHLGDGGIHTLEQLAEAKFSLARGLSPHAPLVVNAQDRHCTRHARRLQRPLYWFALKRPPRALLRGNAQIAALVYIEDGQIQIEESGQLRSLLPVPSVAIGFAGSARHNLANALAATAAALALGVADSHIVASLIAFGKHYLDNPGRANLFRIRGALVLADYGHNPEGLAAIFRIISALPHRRLLISFGQAGDRSDQDMRDLADQVAKQRPQRVLIKDMPSMLRGREPGEIPEILVNQLAVRGLDSAQIQVLEGDPAALGAALDWLLPEDLAVLFVHSNSATVLAELAELAQMEPPATT